VPSTETVIVPPLTVTTTCRAAVRSAGMLLLVAIQLGAEPELHVFAMPVKLAAALCENVTRPTAVPAMPQKPRLPPGPPSEVGRAPALGSARINVRPSAPVPPPMVASNAIVIAPDGTAVGQNAEPAATPLAGVSCSFDPGVVPNSEA